MKDNSQTYSKWRRPSFLNSRPLGVCGFLLLLAGCESPRPAYHYEKISIANQIFSLSIIFQTASNREIRGAIESSAIEGTKLSGSGQTIEFRFHPWTRDTPTPDEVRIYDVTISGPKNLWSLRPVNKVGANCVTFTLKTTENNSEAYQVQKMYLPISMRENVQFSFKIDLTTSDDVKTFNFHQKTGVWPTEGFAHHWRNFIGIFGLK